MVLDLTIKVKDKRRITNKRHLGTITAANASSINDGASALLITNEATIKHFNLKPIAKIIGKFAC